MSNQELVRFSEQLRAICGDGDVRPFVCGGSPLGCEIFFVGKSPATLTSHPFWKFWNDHTGFDKDSWLIEYENDRARAGERERSSRTRGIIHQFCHELGESRCLDTNVLPTHGSGDGKVKHAPVLDFLIQHIRPQMVVPYHRRAREYLERRWLAGQRLPDGECYPGTIDGRPTWFFTLSSVPIGWNAGRVTEVASRMRERVGGR